MAFDIYAEVTDRIIKALEGGVIPWLQPWAGTKDGAISYSTGKAYSLLNQFLLGKPGEYLTFKQVEQAGGRVKKGAKSKMVVFWRWIEKEPEFDADGNLKVEKIPFLRYYNVFHIDDCEGIDRKWTKENVTNGNAPIQAAEDVLNGYVNREGIKLINELGNNAYYSPAQDEIHLPLFDQFESAESYYDTAFHESVHSTGHQSRLNRIKTGAAAAFGSEDYSKEELVAEIGACGLMHRLGLETKKTFRNNAAYIQNWLRVLKGDKRMIVSAAGKAEKAIARILNEVNTNGVA